jgi:hypothetical protein
MCKINIKFVGHISGEKYKNSEISAFLIGNKLPTGILRHYYFNSV